MVFTVCLCKMLPSVTVLSAILLSVSFSAAQLTGSVGPTTSTASKQKTICNVLNYGGSIGSSVGLHHFSFSAHQTKPIF